MRKWPLWLILGIAAVTLSGAENPVVKKGEDYLFYGYCFLLKKWMWGMFSLAHLQAIKLPYGFHLEMDEGLSLKPLNQIPQTPYFKRQSSVRKELKYEPSV